ncbi:MAG: hypothetical protein ACP5GD_00910 [Candidatus Micrarchaeia archaeon]
MEKVGDLESRVERAYLDAYNLLMSRGLERYGLMGVDEIKVSSENNLANNPKGPLLIPREVIEKKADLELFIAQELLRRMFWSDILPENRDEPVDGITMDRLRIAFGALELTDIEYKIERGNPWQMNAILANNIILAKIKVDTSEALKTFVTLEAHVPSDGETAVVAFGAAFELYAALIPAYVLYKLHKKRGKVLNLENTIGLAFNLQRLAKEEDLPGFLEEGAAMFNLELAELSKDEEELRKKLKALFESTPSTAYPSLRIDAMAEPLANAVIVARRIVKEIETGELERYERHISLPSKSIKRK